MSKTIFIIDDEQAICDGLSEILDDYITYAFTSGSEALKHLEENNPDLCIVDFRMPDMSGIKLIENIKDMKPDVKFFLLTGSLMEIDNSKVSQLGIDRVLGKPISRKDILFYVKDSLGEATQNHEESEKSNHENVSPVEEDSNSFSINEGSNPIDIEESWKRGTVLIVDDKEEIRSSLKETLLANNYSVSTAKNGIEALNIVQQEDYDIILMDIHMPGMGGIEAVSKIKSLKPKAFVVMMTGEADNKEVKDAISKGGYACLRKPFTSKKLLKSLEWYSDAGKELKKQYEIAEKINNIPEIQKKSANLFQSIKSSISSNRMRILTLVLSLISIVIGFLIFIFVQYTGSSISSSVKEKVSKYDSYAESIIGYLARDEKRELKQ